MNWYKKIAQTAPQAQPQQANPQQQAALDNLNQYFQQSKMKFKSYQTEKEEILREYHSLKDEDQGQIQANIQDQNEMIQKLTALTTEFDNYIKQYQQMGQAVLAEEAERYRQSTVSLQRGLLGEQQGKQTMKQRQQNNKTTFDDLQQQTQGIFNNVFNPSNLG